MIYDMQRIGNQASDITEIIRFVKGEDVINRIPQKEEAAAPNKWWLTASLLLCPRIWCWLSQ